MEKHPVPNVGVRYVFILLVLISLSVPIFFLSCYEPPPLCQFCHFNDGHWGISYRQTATDCSSTFIRVSQWSFCWFFFLFKFFIRSLWLYSKICLRLLCATSDACNESWNRSVFTDSRPIPSSLFSFKTNAYPLRFELVFCSFIRTLFHCRQIASAPVTNRLELISLLLLEFLRVLFYYRYWLLKILICFL